MDKKMKIGLALIAVAIFSFGLFAISNPVSATGNAAANTAGTSFQNVMQPSCSTCQHSCGCKEAAANRTCSGCGGAGCAAKK